MKRADSKRTQQGNGVAGTATALSHGPSNGTRHRRLASSRLKPAKVCTGGTRVEKSSSAPSTCAKEG